MFKLEIDLRKQKEQIRIENEGKILKGFFEPYIKTIVGSRPPSERSFAQLIEVFFIQLANFDHKNFSDVALREQMRVGGTYQGSVFKAKSRKLNEMLMNSFYATISVVPILLLATKLARATKAIIILRLLSRVISLTI